LREDNYYTVSQKASPTFSTITWKPIIKFWCYALLPYFFP